MTIDHTSEQGPYRKDEHGVLRGPSHKILVGREHYSGLTEEDERRLDELKAIGDNNPYFGTFRVRAAEEAIGALGIQAEKPFANETETSKSI